MHKLSPTSRRTARRGFSLTEVMIAASLSLMVFAVAFSAMIRFGRVQYSLVTQADLDREFRYALNLITDDIRGLKSIEVERPTDQEAEQGALPDVLIALPNIENAQGVLPDKTEIVYLVDDSGVLRRTYTEYTSMGTELEKQSMGLLSGVTEFDIVRVGGSSSFDLTLSCTRTAAGKDYDKVLNTRIASRN